ncbi:hypothetical protein BDR06DRAFT_482720 [Suillus hirtellus]|nr:hypothetical protein BDR06DRAFT_482720 [Suillus hirtellus]
MMKRSKNFTVATSKRLGTRVDQGVVDARLNVYGATNLKADLSIVPKNVGTNTYSTALIIGEKAAMIIAEDSGIEYRL